MRVSEQMAIDLLAIQVQAAAAVIGTKGLVTPVCNVVGYSADPTGVLDSTLAFRAALVDVLYYGRPLYIPSGFYLLSSTLTVTKNITIYGDGIGNSVLMTTNNNLAFITIVCNADIYNMNIHDLQFLNSGTGPTQTQPAF